MALGRRSLLVAAAIALGAQLLGGAALGAEPSDDASSEIVVMTRNLYLGADVTVALDRLPDVSAAAQAMWAQVAQTDFSARAPALASDVVAADPAVIGLQEATVWECLDPGGAPVAVYDFTSEFLDALHAAGRDYVIAGADGATAVSPGFSIAPIAGATVVTDPENLPPVVGSESAACGFRLADVLAVRADLADRVVAVGSSTYARGVSLVPGVIEVERGYAWADLDLDGEVVRFVTTHLESLWDVDSEPPAAAQARQLVSELAAVTGPLVVMGDFNSDPRDPRPAGSSNPGGQPEQSATCPDRTCSAYWSMVGGGFVDAGPDATDAANRTWGADALLAGPSPERLPVARAEGNPDGFTDRLDYVFVRGDLEVAGARLVGQHWPDDPAVWDCDSPEQVTLTRQNALAMGVAVPSGGRCLATDHAGLEVTLALAGSAGEATTDDDLGAEVWWVVAVGVLALLGVAGVAVAVLRS